MEDKMVTEARQIIEGIRKNQINNSNSLENMSRQVDDLKTAIRKIDENTSKPIIIDGDDAVMKNYIRDNGTLRMKTEKTAINIPGHGMVNTELEGLLDTKSNHSNWHAELKEICKTRTFAKMLVKNTPKSDARLVRHLGNAPGFMKDVISKSLYDTAGKGAEFVPDEFRDSLYIEFSEPKRLAEQFETVPVTGNTINIPRLNWGGRPFRRGAVTSDVLWANEFDASTPQTGNASVSITGFATRYRVDTDLIEDSALQLVPILSRQIYDDLTDCYEDAMINGDSRGSNTTGGQDVLGNWNIRNRWSGGSYSATKDHRGIFDGFRRQSFARGTNSATILGAATMINADIVSMMSALGEHASQALILVTSPELFIREFLPLTAVNTVDQFGPAATILTGQLAAIYGIPIIISRFIDTQTNASGVFDNVTKTHSGVILVNKASYKHYQRSGISVETSKEIGSGALEIVSTLRRTMDSPDQATTTNVGWFYNSAVF